MEGIHGKHLKYLERRRQAAEEIRAAWDLSHTPPQDPGLREIYHTIPRAPVRIICSALGKDVNQGGILRLAEAFRLERVDYEPPNGEAFDFTAATGVEPWQPCRWVQPETAIDEAKAEGYRVYGMTLIPGARAIQDIEWQFPCAIVLGEEKDGMRNEIVELCDEHIGIPLYGLIPSINVSTATAIAIYEVIKAYQQANPEFEPVRNLSRRLLNLNEAEYLSELAQNETF